MDNQSLPVRVFAAGLPLVVIALIFGALGYVTADRERAPVPQLADADSGARAAQGEIESVSGNRITLVTQAGERLEFELSSSAPIEVLEAIAPGDLQIGDWLNGGAIPHADTVLALISLILLPDPVTP